MQIDHLYLPHEKWQRDECDRKVSDTPTGPSRLCGRPRREHLQIVCARCGDEPTPDEARYTAKLNGTHWRRIEHGAGIPGRATPNAQARSCGPWVKKDASPAERSAAMDEWRARKAEPHR